MPFPPRGEMLCYPCVVVTPANQTSTANLTTNPQQHKTNPRSPLDHTQYEPLDKNPVVNSQEREGGTGGHKEAATPCIQRRNPLARLYYSTESYPIIVDYM